MLPSLLAPGDPRLAPSTDRALLLAAIADVGPHPFAGAAVVAAGRPGAVDRVAPTHFTASVVPFDPDAGAVQLVHHGRYRRWMQIGGHCDGDTNAAGVASRELCEETGLVDHVLWSACVDIGSHEGARAPEHAHIDLRFAAVVPGAASRAVRSPEGLTLGWFGLADLAEVCGSAKAAWVTQATGVAWRAWADR